MAALCIETGHYERSISCLMEALQLSDHENVYHLHGVSFQKPVMEYHRYYKTYACQCKHCSLEECILFSERTPFHTPQSTDMEVDIVDNDDVTSIDGGGYIHRRPIRITPQSTQEHHYMGVTLSLIITFNLALAHHLSALQTFGWSNTRRKDNAMFATTNVVHETSRKSSACKKTFQNILDLYELAYRWQLELEDDRHRKETMRQEYQPDHANMFWNDFHDSSSLLELNASPVSSLRFNMVISNNLSQIHRLVQNHSKHQRCLEHLLATVMFVVVTDGATQQHWNSSSSSSSSSTNTPTVSSLHHQQQQQQQTNHPYMNFEGFLQNATPLILLSTCAATA